ncbi:hypothetical protein QAD02_000291 [Eretmocerus hayati]|uniref:Uncharacterized protein n=1 Tax=Eretmocerus hayati TaxID=131215 RepID=A0ACC2ND21_9HYME|nr:hypothetical protein QAD02_000291 [Eretmocerus hayati]
MKSYDDMVEIEDGKGGRIITKLLPEVLRATELQIISKEQCGKYNVGNLEGRTCVMTAGKKFCDEDSGGAVVFDNHMVGVVSECAGNCTDTEPATYSDIGYYREWIDRKFEEWLTRTKNNVQ